MVREMPKYSNAECYSNMPKFYRGLYCFIVTGAEAHQVESLTTNRPWTPHRIGVDGTYYLAARGRMSEAHQALVGEGFTFVPSCGDQQ